ncbi:hypothetical protein N7491_005657 [Penicillium cf. griseofulvum]|uniref:Uncharacterized protein n=1 Tax=Penicillium cf. griseofulvum TaxID=2972120 RepID=A0A9W9J2C9_9EURO|nr:hypothetical protein N7472_008342 [Penicillium cf. griseofulvum]KAJ5435062.1 hypothetical protein N7491_005657 [Penicillium cf. griseofulvum]KAJ5452900.1 hypothetical protein N7445_001083 [Penicillium cf. griseofulvum]
MLMSDPDCRSDARVELATAVGTWLGPILGAITTVLMANVLDAHSKTSPAASDLESSTSDRCNCIHEGITADIESARQELF